MISTPDKCLLLSLLIALCGGTAHAQHDSPHSDALVTIDYIPMLNAGRINRILRDNRGFLWFGTGNGLWKYDGYEGRVYENISAHDSIFALENRVTSLLNNPDSTLLLATWAGLWRFDPLTERFEAFMKDTRVGNQKIEALARDASGTLWIGTHNDGVYRYGATTGDLRHYSVQDGLSDSSVCTLLVDRRGNVWIGMRTGGLNCIDPATSRITCYRNNPADPSSLPPEFVTALCQQAGDSICVGTYQGLHTLDPATGRLQRIRIPEEPDAAVSALAKDPFGRLWVGFAGGGLYAISPSAVMHFSGRGTENTSLSEGIVVDIYVDPTSTRDRTLLWVGTRGGGVNKIIVKRNPFQLALRDQGSFQIGRGAVLAMCEDRKGTLWVGTWGGGLSTYRRVKGEYAHLATYGHTSGGPFHLPSDDIYSLFEDHKGQLWIGTEDGLCMLDPDRRHLTTYNHSASDTASIVGDIVSVVKEDSRGNLWICTPRGLSRFVRGKPDYFRNYLHTAKEASPWGGNDVTDIVEDRSSDIWVTMRGRGLNKFDREHDRFVRFAYPGDSTGERENWMNRVCEDRRGILWMPTNGGLVLFDPRSNRFSPFESNFLQRTFVFDIVADNSEHMWLATGFGLLRLTPATGMVVRYDRTHGFTFNELTSEFFPTPRGGLYVGGLDGFAEFAPDSMVESKRVPSIAITEFTIFGKPQPLPSQEIHLAHNQNFFSFSFAVLDYVNPSLNRFAYRMEGLDADWIDAGTRHHVSYTNLTPGDYVFRVKGTNSDGVWNDPGILVRVAIAPPYWRTWWFALLTAAIAAASVTTVYRYRVGKLLEMQRIRLRIASDLHDDVGSNLGAIAFASKTLQNTPDLSPATRLRLTSIYDLAVKTSEGMRDIVWFITPERDNIDDLVLHMKDAATSVLGPIEHRFEDRSGSADVHLSLEFRRKVFLAFKETLANVVKHAGATRVDIEVSRENGMLVVSVRDNGKGFDEQTARKGNGLANLRSRARSAGGDCTITSAAAKGTTVKFTAALET